MEGLQGKRGGGMTKPKPTVVARGEIHHAFSDPPSPMFLRLWPIIPTEARITEIHVKYFTIPCKDSNAEIDAQLKAEKEEFEKCHKTAKKGGAK